MDKETLKFTKVVDRIIVEALKVEEPEPTQAYLPMIAIKAIAECDWVEIQDDGGSCIFCGWSYPEHNEPVCAYVLARKIMEDE